LGVTDALVVNGCVVVMCAVRLMWAARVAVDEVEPAGDRGWWWCSRCRGRLTRRRGVRPSGSWMVRTRVGSGAAVCVGDGERVVDRVRARAARGHGQREIGVTTATSTSATSSAAAGRSRLSWRSGRRRRGGRRGDGGCRGRGRLGGGVRDCVEGIDDVSVRRAGCEAAVGCNRACSWSRRELRRRPGRRGSR